MVEVGLINIVYHIRLITRYFIIWTNRNVYHFLVIELYLSPLIDVNIVANGA